MKPAVRREVNDKAPFHEIETVKNDRRLDKKLYKKPADTGLLLYFQSHDNT